MTPESRSRNASAPFASRPPASTCLGSLPSHGEGIALARRPDTCYYHKSTQPLEYTFELACPDTLDPATAMTDVETRIRELEAEAARELAAAGRDIVGRRQLLRQDPYDSATSWEKRRGLNPTFAGGDSFAREEAAQRKKSWYLAYRAAYERWRTGNRTVEFRAGTWALRQYHAYRCAPLPLPACA
jgi:putative transposase